MAQCVKAHGTLSDLFLEENSSHLCTCGVGNSPEDLADFLTDFC